MLSRENRILSELIVSRGLAAPEAVERRARDLGDSNEHDLVEALVASGELDLATGQSIREEAREIGGLLRAELPEGKTLGEYRLIREIGRGGMGIVYEAEQPSLARRVALKVLPAGAALDEHLAIRFLREARAAARLSHPGIVPVFGTGREQGVLYFAMELVDGETVAQRIERGPLAARDAARIASEIARALHHAHEAGLIHRDVKPDNVILDVEGRARLADFGLVHDLHAARLTRAQYVLGTPAYTAPEQTRNAPVDARTDVYGAGAVLYAMLAGRPPYDGEVAAAVLGRLMHGPPPPLATVAPGTPAALISICERAMARAPDRRHQTAQSLAEALESFQTQAHEPDSSVRPARLALRVAVGIVAATALAVAASFLWFRQTGRDPADADGPALVTGPAGNHRSFRTAPGWKREIALSPDGETLAYVSAPGARIFLQRAGESEPRRLVLRDEPQSAPAWSPDGSRIAYCSADRLVIAELASGNVRATGESCGPMSWSPDGTRIVYASRPLPGTRLSVYEVVSGGSVLISGPGASSPAWSADGRIAFVGVRDGQYDIFTVREDGSDPRRVTNDAARETHPAWSSMPGVLYYASNRDESPDLWKVHLDPVSGEVHSAPARVTRGWFGAPFRISIARKLERLAFVHEIDLTQLWILSSNPASRSFGIPVSARLDVPFDAGLPQRSPVGDDWIAVGRRGNAENLRRFGPRSDTSWVTDGSYHDGSPRWSPDGTSIAFHSDRSGTTQIWTVRADGTHLGQVTSGLGQARHPVWSPDGARLAYSVDGSGAWVKELGRGNPTHLLDGFEPWSWSGDGRSLAGTAGGIVVVELATGHATQVTRYGERPSWLAGSDGLLFTSEDRILHWNGSGEPLPIWSTGPSRLSAGLSLTPGGREAWVATSASSEHIWLLDLDAPLTE